MMNHRIRILARLKILLAAFGMAIYTTNCDADPKLQVTAKTERKGANIELEFSVTPQNDLRIESAALPWRWPSSLILVITPATGNSQLKQTYIPISPIPGFSDLRKGVAYSGSVPLNNSFLEVAKESAKQDLILFWYFSIDQLGMSAKDNKYGGWLLIPQHGEQ